MRALWLLLLLLTQVFIQALPVTTLRYASHLIKSISCQLSGNCLKLPKGSSLSADQSYDFSTDSSSTKGPKAFEISALRRPNIYTKAIPLASIDVKGSRPVFSFPSSPVLEKPELSRDHRISLHRIPILEKTLKQKYPALYQKLLNNLQQNPQLLKFYIYSWNSKHNLILMNKSLNSLIKNYAELEPMRKARLRRLRDAKFAREVLLTCLKNKWVPTRDLNAYHWKRLMDQYNRMTHLSKQEDFSDQSDSSIYSSSSSHSSSSSNNEKKKKKKRTRVKKITEHDEAYYLQKVMQPPGKNDHLPDPATASLSVSQELQMTKAMLKIIQSQTWQNSKLQQLIFLKGWLRLTDLSQEEREDVLSLFEEELERDDERMSFYLKEMVHALRDYEQWEQEVFLPEFQELTK